MKKFAYTKEEKKSKLHVICDRLSIFSLLARIFRYNGFLFIKENMLEKM